MKRKSIGAASVAIASGILVLAGYFVSDIKSPAFKVLIGLRALLVDWAVILAAFAVITGVFNLLFVHFEKVRKKQKGRAYSAILIVFLVATFLFGLVLGPKNPGLIAAFMTIQLPVEASLMALLAVTLTYASIRLLRRRQNLFSALFLIVALLTILGSLPLPVIGAIPGVGNFFRNLFAVAGARGILLGVSLGALMTGLRILFGADRPYGGN